MAVKKKKPSQAKKPPASSARGQTKSAASAEKSSSSRPVPAQKKSAIGTRRKLGGRKAPAEKEPPPATLVQSDPTALEIIRRIRSTFAPTFMTLENLTSRHKQHAGRGSGNHYELRVVSDLFNGLSLLQRSQWVNSLVSDLYGKVVHALKLDLKSPEENPLPEFQPQPLARQLQKRPKKS